MLFIEHMAHICGGHGDICSLVQRMCVLESDNASLRRQLQVLTAEVGLIVENVKEKLGVSVVNTDSVYFDLLHNVGSLESDKITKSLAVAVAETEVACSTDLVVINGNGSNDAASEPINSREREIVEMEAETPAAIVNNLGNRFGDGVGDEAQKGTCIVKEGQGQGQGHGQGSQGPSTSNMNGHIESTNETSAASAVSAAAGNLTREGLQKCPFCTKRFTSPKEKSEHEWFRTENPRAYHCPYCCKGYNNNMRLEGHVRRRHPGERP